MALISIFPSTNLLQCDFFIRRAFADRQFDDNKDFNSIYVSEQERLHHPIISNIEKRMAAITGSPIHRYEEPSACHMVVWDLWVLVLMVRYLLMHVQYVSIE